MALVLADRVRETTTVTGTGTATLLGAVSGYQSFSEVGDANTTYYVIANQSATEWEVGIGTYTSSGTTLSRTTVLSSSNSGSLVNFTAGTKDVFVDYPASKAVYEDASGNVDGYPITGGTINNTTIGATTPTTGSFTNITGSANAIISVTDNTNAALRITQLGTGNALLVEDSTNPDSTPVLVDANGAVVQGYTVAINNWNGAPDSIASHSTASNARPSVGLYNWSSNTARIPGFYLYKSLSNAIGTRGILGNLQALGRLVFSGDDGATFIRAAEIDAIVDGTPGLNDMPGALRFNTTADGASAPTERVRITSAGNVGIGTTPNASALLDVQSTTKGVRMPNMTTTQKNAIASPAAGLMVFDTTLAKLCVYSGISWETITSI